MLEVACRGRYGVARLIERYGAEMGLPDLRVVLAGDYPRVRAVSIHDRCGMHFPEVVAAALQSQMR